MALSRKNIILIALLVLVCAGAAYFLFFQNDPNDALIETEGPGSEAQATFINLAAQLEPIAFDSRILENQRFMALQDIHTAIVPESSGRSDPFSPLSGVAAPR